MRSTYWMVAVLVATVALADDAATTKTAVTSANGSSAGQDQAAPRTRPLHRHPTLFSMLVRSNNLRRRAGLWPHRMNPALVAAAQDHANFMAQTGQFSHYVNAGPQGRASKYGYAGGVRENIATGGNVDTAFGMWTASGAHYASIVSGTTDAGFGYAVGPSGATYFVGLYGSGTTSGSETEEQIAEVLKEEEETSKVAAAKTAADDDQTVTPASAVVEGQQKPAAEVTPAAAVESGEGK